MLEESIPVIPERPKKKSDAVSSSEKIDSVESPGVSPSPVPVIPPRPKKGRGQTQDDVSIERDGDKVEESEEAKSLKMAIDPATIDPVTIDPVTIVPSMDSPKPILTESGQDVSEYCETEESEKRNNTDTRNEKSAESSPIESTEVKEPTPVIPPRPSKSKSSDNDEKVDLESNNVKKSEIPEPEALKSEEVASDVREDHQKPTVDVPVAAVNLSTSDASLDAAIPAVPPRPKKAAASEDEDRAIEAGNTIAEDENGIEDSNEREEKDVEVMKEETENVLKSVSSPKVTDSEIKDIPLSNLEDASIDKEQQITELQQPSKEGEVSKDEPTEALKSSSTEELKPAELEDQCPNEVSEIPIIPKRPSKQLSEAPVEALSETSTHTPSGASSSSDLTESAKNDATKDTPLIPPRPKKPVATGKVPPPKPNKLSSKIAAFQQMFDLQEPTIEQKRPAPLARKWSGDKSGIASNLQNIMARGIPLPGMAKPGPIPSPSSPSKEDIEEVEESTADSSQPPRAVSRRAKGPRGKKLPKLVQDTKIIVEPRFKVVSTDLWAVQIAKAVSNENDGVTIAIDSGDEVDKDETNVAKVAVEDYEKNLDEDMVDGEDDPDAGVEIEVDQESLVLMENSEKERPFKETVDQNKSEDKTSDNIVDSKSVVEPEECFAEPQLTEAAAELVGGKPKKFVESENSEEIEVLSTEESSVKRSSDSLESSSVTESDSKENAIIPDSIEQASYPKTST